MIDKAHDVRILPPDRSLLYKLGTMNLDQVFSEKIVQTAQQVIISSSEHFVDDTLDSAKRLEKFKAILDATPEKANEILPQIAEASFSMKTNASLAGYDLVANIAQSLHAVGVRVGSKDLSPTNLQIILWHLDSIQKVMALKVKGMGGETGEAIQKKLVSIEKMFSKE